MSNLGKGLLIFALLGAIAAGVLGYLVTGKYSEAKSDRDAANTKVTTLSGQLKTAQTDLKTAQDSQKTAEQKATDDDTKITDLNNQLTQAQKDAADAKSALQAAQNDATAAKAQVTQMTTDLGGKTVSQYKDDVAAAEKNAADAQAQQKVLQDSLDQANEKVKGLISDINNEGKKVEPPGVSGKVTFVDRTWNFVVLDVGLDAGVVPNGELIIYRGKTFLGKVRVTRADPSDAVAEILPDNKGQIQVGDAVLN
jgi:multidrug efflux pump subunit AcrA (membrane-fusion protein)